MVLFATNLLNNISINKSIIFNAKLALFWGKNMKNFYENSIASINQKVNCTIEGVVRHYKDSYSLLQSAKIILVHPKCEINLVLHVTLLIFSLSNIWTLLLLEKSLLLFLITLTIQFLGSCCSFSILQAISFLLLFAMTYKRNKQH